MLAGMLITIREGLETFLITGIHVLIGYQDEPSLLPTWEGAARA